jgi:hypothetical protein
LPQRLSFNIFSNDELTLFRFDKIVDRDDIRVIERRSGASFLLEASQPVGILSHGRRQEFQDDHIFQSNMPRLVDLSHTSRVDELNHFVIA